jgi:hypothetical protein
LHGAEFDPELRQPEKANQQHHQFGDAAEQSAIKGEEAPEEAAQSGVLVLVVVREFHQRHGQAGDAGQQGHDEEQPDRQQGGVAQSRQPGEDDFQCGIESAALSVGPVSGRPALN